MTPLETVRKSFNESSENLNISDVRVEFNFYDIIDILQTIKVLYNIENNLHPTITKESDKYKEFKKWYEDEYLKSDKLDKIIKKLNYET
jgi:hypothetical protein